MLLVLSSICVHFAKVINWQTVQLQIVKLILNRLPFKSCKCTNFGRFIHCINFKQIIVSLQEWLQNIIYKKISLNHYWMRFHPKTLYPSYLLITIGKLFMGKGTIKRKCNLPTFLPHTILGNLIGAIRSSSNQPQLASILSFKWTYLPN